MAFRDITFKSKVIVPFFTFKLHIVSKVNHIKIHICLKMCICLYEYVEDGFG